MSSKSLPEEGKHPSTNFEETFSEYEEERYGCQRFSSHGSRSSHKSLESSPLLHSQISREADDPIFDPPKPFKICGLTYNNPPIWLIHFTRVVTWERVKIALVLLAMVVAAVVFSLNKEEEEGSRELMAVSLPSPLYVESEEAPDSWKAVLEIRIVVQDTPVPYEVAVQPMACPKGDSCSDDFGLLTPLGDEFMIVTSAMPANKLHRDDTEELVERHDFFFDGIELSNYHEWYYLITTNSTSPIGITFHDDRIFSLVKAQVPIAAAILAFVYVLIVFELFHRTLCALVGSFVAVGVLSVIHARPSFLEVVSWIDFDTIGLLFGMMIMVGIFSETGFFEYSAVKAYKLSRGNLWRLTLILCIFTAVVSAFLDNVTTILLLTPVTVRLCKVLDVKPEPILIAEVMLSNIGGTATAIGDPPNIIIVNDPQVAAQPGIDFFQFSLHVAPGVVLASIVSLVLLYFLFKSAIKREPHQGKLREIKIWKETARKIHENESEENRHVKEQLLEYIEKLEQEIAENPDEPDVQDVDIAHLEETYRIHDIPLFVNSCIVLGCVIVMFFLHSWIEDWVDLSLAWIAIIGAVIHLVVSGIKDVEEVLEKVELGTLLFFAALFVLMRALEELGLIEFIGDQTSSLIGKVPEGNGRLAVAILVIMWVSALVSAFIDNIPYTTAMVPVVVTLGTGDLGLPIQPLVWALSYGTCFGGNGTLIGASANVVAVGLAEADGYPISFNTFFKTGFPTMVVSMTVATVYMLIVHVWLGWY